MKKQLEYFDELANAQRQVFNNLQSAQKDLRAQWVATLNKTQKAFTSIPGLPDTPQTREALNQFNTWFGAVANSSQNATEEALKFQEYWISAYEKQLAISREILRNFIEVANQGKSSFSFARPAKDKPEEPSTGTPAKPAPAKVAKPAVAAKRATVAKPAKAKTTAAAKPKAVKNALPEVFKTSFKRPTK